MSGHRAWDGARGARPEEVPFGVALRVPFGAVLWLWPPRAPRMRRGISGISDISGIGLPNMGPNAHVLHLHLRLDLGLLHLRLDLGLHLCLCFRLLLGAPAAADLSRLRQLGGQEGHLHACGCLGCRVSAEDPE